MNDRGASASSPEEEKRPERPPASHRSVKRPLGITLLSLAMGWLAFAGIANTASIFWSVDSPFPSYLALFTVAYAITAAATMVALWRMRGWAVTAFRSWVAVCVILMLGFTASILFADIAREIALLSVGFDALALLVFWLLDRYIAKKVRPRQQT